MAVVKQGHFLTLTLPSVLREDCLSQKGEVVNLLSKHLNALVCFPFLFAN
jgi:hypothetical protein